MAVESSAELRRRAAVHAALADPARLGIVDTLLLGDASPSELQALLTMPSNLMAHHLAVLARAGLVSRSRSEGDRRRTYLRVVAAELSAMLPAATRDARRVLFLCTHNAGRSQIAMAERGIDISGEYPKPRTDEIVHAADVVAGMGCGDTCPVLPGHRYEEWVLDDPAGRSLGDVRPIRDEIERRVRLLLTELGVPARAKQPRRW